MQTFYIVSPFFNSREFMDAAINSIISQSGDFVIRYHVQDGGSTDGTVERLREWQKILSGPNPLVKCRDVHFSWVSEADQGMYFAINRAFSYLDIPDDGIMGWCNADDLYVPYALSSVAKVFTDVANLEFLVGRWYTYQHQTLGDKKLHNGAYPREIVQNFCCDTAVWSSIAQPSVFWKHSLWQKAGGLDESLKYAADFELWARFARHADCVQLPLVLSIATLHKAQLSATRDDLGMTYYERDKNSLCSKKERLKFGRKFWSKRILPPYASVLVLRKTRYTMTRVRVWPSMWGSDWHHYLRNLLQWRKQGFCTEFFRKQFNVQSQSQKPTDASGHLLETPKRQNIRGDHTMGKITKPAAILGNGPSLRGFDFKENLKKYDTFGMNAAYRYWDAIGWYPNYYSCLDVVVSASHKEEILRLIERSDEYGIRGFLLRENFIQKLGGTGRHPKVSCLEDLRRSGVPFVSSPRITTGSHTMGWAAYLGYTNLVLLGIDANYVEFVDGAKRLQGTTLEITKDLDTNPNYFFDDYQRKGDKYNIPNPNSENAPHVHSWLELQPVLTSHEICVINANPNSKVEVFPKYPFSEAAEALKRERKALEAKMKLIFPNRRQKKLLQLFYIVIGPMLRTEHRNKLRTCPVLYFAKAKHPVNVVFKKILKIFGPAPQ